MHNLKQMAATLAAYQQYGFSSPEELDETLTAARYFKAHGITKLPASKALQREIEQLTAQKNAGYNDYREKPADEARQFLCGMLGADESGKYRLAFVGQSRYRQELFRRVYCKRPHGAGSRRVHDELCIDTQ